MRKLGTLTGSDDDDGDGNGDCNSKTKPLNEPPHDKTNKVAVRPAKTQISLGIRPV